VDLRDEESRKRERERKESAKNDRRVGGGRTKRMERHAGYADVSAVCIQTHPAI